MEAYFWLLWLVLAIVFLVVELGTVAMVSLWFVAGSLIAMVAAFLKVGFGWQLVIFLGSSFIFLLIFLKFRDKLGILPAQTKPTNADRLIGKEAVVIMDVDPKNNTGQVQVEGQIWSARTDGENLIAKGTKVKVLALRGVKLVVEAY